MNEYPSRRDIAAALAALASAPLAPADDKPAEPPADPRLAIVKARYGKPLTDEQLASIAARLRASPLRADALYRVSLKNGDEPAFVFGVE